MPYTIDDPPDFLRELPSGAQRLFIAAFNSKYSENSNDEDSMKVGWSNVKRKYKKIGDKWVKKNLSVEVDDYIEDGSKLPDDVLELPDRLPLLWKETFNKSVCAGIPVIMSRKKAWKYIKKYVFLNKKNGKWFLKRNDIPNNIVIDTGRIKPMNPVVSFFKSSDSNAFFKMFVPIGQVSKIEKTKDGYLLEGVASSMVLDRQDDIMSEDFIKKMEINGVGLNVFIDHKTDSDHLIGSVIKTIDNNETLFLPVSKLEEPDDNPLVKKLLKRMADGIKFGYSIGGSISKAVKIWSDTLNKYVRYIIDGEIYELSVVPVPALPGSDVRLTTKNFSNNLFVKGTDCSALSEFKSFLESKHIDEEMLKKDICIDDINIDEIKKLVVSTLSDSIDATNARHTLSERLNLFNDCIWQVIYSNMSVDEKIRDIKELGEQLSNSIKELSDKMSREIMINYNSM
jgi:cation transport regulator ChaB